MSFHKNRRNCVFRKIQLQGEVTQNHFLFCRMRKEAGLRVAAVAYCEAADRFVNSASPRAAAPRSLDAVLCPDTLQPPHSPDGRGTATGRRQTRPAGGLPPTVPTQTRGSLRAVIEFAGTCITFETFVCSLEALLDQGPGAP